MTNTRSMLTSIRDMADADAALLMLAVISNRAVECRRDGEVNWERK